MHDRNCTAARRSTVTLAARLLAVISLGIMSSAGAQSAQTTQNPQPNPEVLVTTSMGSFVIELRPDRAPLTVANFLRYVQTGFYTDTLIHRVVGNFIIQGGGHEATPPYALKPTGAPVVNESGNGLENRRGTVGLARSADPDSGTSQFYINLVDNPELDPLPTRWGYTVFGKVVQGMNVVERIGLVPTGAFGPFKSQAPLKPVVIQNITLITPSQPGTAAPASSAPANASPPAPAAAAAPAKAEPPGSSSSASPPTAPPAGRSATEASGESMKTAPPANPTGAPPNKP